MIEGSIENQMHKVNVFLATGLLLTISFLSGPHGSTLVRAAETDRSPLDYADPTNWMYWGSEVRAPKGDVMAEMADDRIADVFFIAPSSTTEDINADMSDAEQRAAILNSTNMEIGIYCEQSLLYAPYYRMASLGAYETGGEVLDDALNLAYEDVKAAFDRYLQEKDPSRPLILAGFSQGSYMMYRLMEDEFDDETLQRQLVAAYGIGWACTEEMSEEYPQLKMAQGEDDTGVIISFECEAPNHTETGIVPADVKMQSINPLNWKTTSEPAGKELNDGYVLVDGTEYEVAETAEHLCGAYIDDERGTLKVTDVTPEEYPGVLSFVDDGCYHIYDYEFFYRNLQDNVACRLAAYLE